MFVHDCVYLCMCVGPCMFAYACVWFQMVVSEWAC